LLWHFKPDATKEGGAAIKLLINGKPAGESGGWTTRSLEENPLQRCGLNLCDLLLNEADRRNPLGQGEHSP
jgi:hypothetical protein